MLNISLITSSSLFSNDNNNIFPITFHLLKSYLRNNLIITQVRFTVNYFSKIDISTNTEYTILITGVRFKERFT